MNYTDDFLVDFKKRYQGEPEFVQSVEEVVGTLQDFLDTRPDLVDARILERLTEPERILTFRVSWLDDKNLVQVNTGYRVQFSSVLGPYKGGLRFSPSVTLSTLKFLAFEQIFKNSLTGLWLGGAKGGADFDPKGKSDMEIMRFCQAFMTELANHIGPDKDIPAGDVGVGSREIGYLFGWYKKLANEFNGSLTGKNIEWGGSNLRPEATGYGLLYFVKEILDHHKHQISGQTVVISGAGNVAEFAAEKAIDMGMKVLTLSDSTGFIYDKEGISKEKLTHIQKIKAKRGTSLREVAKKYPSIIFNEGQKPWSVKASIYLPCAIENEIDGVSAKQIIKNKPILLAEGANMPTTPEALRLLDKSGILFAPAKACNAGGVAVSGFEMAQNSSKTSLSHEEVDSLLKKTMASVHSKCQKYGQKEDGTINYLEGANQAAFARVAEAMLAQGVI